MEPAQTNPTNPPVRKLTPDQMLTLSLLVLFRGTATEFIGHMMSESNPSCFRHPERETPEGLSISNALVSLACFRDWLAVAIDQLRHQA